MTVRTNRVQNPKFQNNDNFWSPDADFTINTGSGGALSGGYVRQISASGFANFTTVNDGVNGYEVTPNTDYRMSFYIKVDQADIQMPQVQINGDAAYGVQIGGDQLFDSEGAWERFWVDFNSDEFDLVFLRIYNNNGNVDIRYSNFMLEELDTAAEYFDGDSTDGGGITYDWLGSANASQSTKTTAFDVLTKTFTVDGIIFATNTKTFTVDGIVANPGTSESDIDITENMNVTPSGDLLGDASYVAGSPGYVQLTEAQNNQVGALDYENGVPDKFILEADLYALGQADSNFVYWGCADVPDSEDADEGGYVAALDEYEGDGDAGTVELQFGGDQLAKVVYPRDLGDGTIRTLKVVKDDMRIRVYVNRVLVIDYTDIVRSYAGNHLGVGARTGGLNSEHRLYRFSVQGFTGDYHPTPVTSGLANLPYRSIDVMKFTKDTINGQPSASRIRAIVKALADNFNLTHISIAIPLDRNADYEAVGTMPGPSSVELFTQLWADAIHDEGLKVLFRGDFNAWERTGATGNWNFILEVGTNRIDIGTVGTAPTDGQTTALGKLDDYIRNNPNFFQDGDIFAPCPERTENNTQINSIASITRSGTTATVTFSGNHDVGDQQPVRIFGADQSEYNGSFIATKISDTVFTIQVSGSPATPATGTLQSQFGVSPYTDENSVFSHGGAGVNENYATFFEDAQTVADNAFSAIGKNVLTGFTANNFSEVESGWIPEHLFDTVGMVSIDHYGVSHTHFEMYSDLVGLFLDLEQPIVLQEWSDYWNGEMEEQERIDYLVDFYNMFCDLYDEGVLDLFNYWGGWVGGVGEGILVDVGTETNPQYEINSFGQVLAQFFGAPEVPPPTGVHGTEYGYFLNDVQLKAPTKFERSFVFQKTDYMTLVGKTVRDTSAIKEKYILAFERLTKAEVDAIDDICALGTAVNLTVNGHDVVNINTRVFPYIGSVVYDIVGSDYRASLELELIEEE